MRTLAIHLMFVACGLAASVEAAEPEIRNLPVRGLQVGATTSIAIDGDNFGKTPRLLLPFPAKQTLKSGSTEKQATFEVALADDVPPGFAHLRIATDGGVSLPIVIGVDRLAQKPLGASIAQMPVALHGSVAASAIVETSFKGKAGQKILIEVEAQRIGSKLRPVVHLYNSRKLQVAWSWGTPSLRGDTRLETTLLEDGAYTIAVHDAEYAAAAPGFFRLKVGQFDFIDQVFPPMIGKDGKSVELIGSKTLRADLPTSGIIVPWPKDGLWSGPRPFVVRSPRAEFLEHADNTKIQELLAGSIAASGRLMIPNEQDRYRIPVMPGSRIKLEVFAERLGSPIDTSLIIRNEAGAELARVEDSPRTLDPVIEYMVPNNISALVLVVNDSQGRGGPRGIYRLMIDPVQGDASNLFELETTTQRASLAASGRCVAPIHVSRNGYLGRIELSAVGLPADIKLEGADIPAEADGALITLRNDNTSATAAVATLHGKGDNGLINSVVLKGHPLEELQPWMATELAVATTTGKAGEFDIEWKNLPADLVIVPARKMLLPVTVKRPDPATPVRLTLMTSQAPPLLNNRPDPNRTLRVERAVEIGAKAADAEVAVLVPGELQSPVYDLAVQAEFLTPDKQRVIATAYTPVKRLPVRWPIIVKLEAGRKSDVKAGGTLEVVGQVERSEGFTGDVALTVTGLPQGARPEPLTVKADATKFSLKIALPANVPSGELRNVKLFAAMTPVPKAPAQRIRSRDVELSITVLAAK